MPTKATIKPEPLISERQATWRKEMAKASKELFKMPNGVMDDVFDGTLREYGDSWSYIGKKYPVTTNEYLLEDFGRETYGHIYFAIVLSSYVDNEECLIESTDELYCNHPDLQFSNYKQLEAQFRSDLGPLLSLFNLITPEVVEAAEAKEA
jgi:hypothetical protein